MLVDSPREGFEVEVEVELISINFQRSYLKAGWQSSVKSSPELNVSPNFVVICDFNLCKKTMLYGITRYKNIHKKQR